MIILKELNELKELIIENGKILSQQDFKEEYATMVFQRLSNDILDKSKSILVLYEAELYAGISTIARSIIESYLYLKYIFEDNYTCASRSEAYYIKGLLDEINFFENVNDDNELKEFLKIGSIKPYYNDGRDHSKVSEELIQRYCDLTNEESISLKSLPKFYSTGKYKKKINGKEKYIYRNNSFSKLCKNMDESILYKVFYNLLSSEVHSTTNEMTKYINGNIIQLCIEINRYVLNFTQKISSTSHLEDNN